MRVASVTPISVAYPEPNDAGATRHLTFCRITAEDGTVGWGEAISMWPEACRATEALIDGMAPLVVGSDPAEAEATHDRLRRHAWWYGPTGVAGLAISAIDIALWDLKGKALGRSVTDLLGGARRDDLPAIASTHAFGEFDDEIDRHGRLVADGYTGVKVGMGKRGVTRLGYDIARDVEFVRRLREAIGPDALLVMDRGAALTWDLAEAIARVRAFEEHGLRWIEEPCEPWDLEGYRRVREHATTLIGGGEQEWDVRGYRSLLEAGVIDVIGCDPGRVGGITAARRIAELAGDAGAWFNAHAWSSAVATAASLALSATAPRCLLFELKPEENPMQHELVPTPFAHEDGRVRPPTAPGLGVEVHEDVLERYRLT